jgi:hypothetical protein
MSTLNRRVAVEVYTAMSRITGGIRTPHLHIRDELNDPRVSLLVFYEMEVAALSDLRSPRLVSGEAWLRKDEVLLAVPHKAKGTTSYLAQQTIESRLGRNEHRLLFEVPPFRVVGNLYFVGKLQIQDALWRDANRFASVSDAEVTSLVDPAVSFAVDEVVLNTARVSMLCTQFDAA